MLPGDFNLRFGSLASHAVGKFAAQKQSPGAKSLHSWMTHNGFLLPSTFEKDHDTSSPHTYTRSSGSKHRIEYIMLNSNAQTYPCVCGAVELDINSVKDHIGVWASHCTPLTQKHRVAKSMPAYNYRLFDDPVRVEAFSI